MYTAIFCLVEKIMVTYFYVFADETGLQVLGCLYINLTKVWIDIYELHDLKTWNMKKFYGYTCTALKEKIILASFETPAQTNHFNRLTSSILISHDNH